MVKAERKSINYSRLLPRQDGESGFFAEVGIKGEQPAVMRRSFRSAGPLAGYVAGVVLPG